MSTRDAGSGLSNLIEGKPQSKLGRIRWHWPDIKAALRDGHQLKQVWECLVLDGIDLSYSKFRTYIVRLRRLEAAGADLPGSASPTRETGPPLQQVTLKRDPLANLRDRVNKRPGFEFDERPPDRKKLI
ncbi:MAG: TraK family protein [Chthonomonadales bacterium]